MPDPSSLEFSANSASDPVPATAVREQLARLVNSPGFVSSPQLCRFLTHIVNRTIDGDLDSLKEFSIAMEVFGRTSDYDPKIDALVRVEARRLRTKLKAYYGEGRGTTDPVLIGLRPGSYVPLFRWLDTQEHQRQEIGTPIQRGSSSVAVLPFVNMSPEQEQDYFCDGISEEIINVLTHVPGLNVIARTSAFQFKGVAIDIRDVGQRLGADLVIEGSVRKAGEQLRISAQAIQTASGHHLWSETFRRELKDVFAIQEEIAQSVAELLRLHVPAVQAPLRSSPHDIKAYERYLRARSLIHRQTPESLQAAVQQLRELIAAFPDYALGYSGIAVANTLRSVFGAASGRDVYAETKECAERGYALDPESAETCRALAVVRSWFEHRWKEAMELYDGALKLQPGHVAAYVMRGMTLLCQGKIDEAESSLRRAMELDPLSASGCARMGYLFYLKGEYRSAVQHLERSFKLDRNYPEARFNKGLLHYRQEDYEGVVHWLSSAAAPMDVGLLAAAHAHLGRSSAAAECVEKLRRLAAKEYVTPLAEGFAAIGMNDFDLAFQRLEEAIDHKTNLTNVLLVEPFFDPLRSDS